MTPEGAVKARGRMICRDGGFPYLPQNASGRTRAGIPDDLVIVNGLAVFIEYKATGKRKPTVSQIRVMEWLRSRGAVTLLVHAGNIEELASDLSQLRTDGASVQSLLATVCNLTHPVKL